MKQEKMNKLVKEASEKIKASREEAIKELMDKLNEAEEECAEDKVEEKKIGGRLTLEDLLDEIDDEDEDMDETGVVVINPEAVDYMNPKSDVDYREISVMYDNKFNSDDKIDDAEVCVEFDEDMPFQTVQTALLKALGETLYAEFDERVPALDSIVTKKDFMGVVEDLWDDLMKDIGRVAFRNTIDRITEVFDHV